MTLFPITGESLPSGGFKSAYNGVIRGPTLPSHTATIRYTEIRLCKHSGKPHHL